MENRTGLHEISYHEYRVIARIVEAHYREYQRGLKAVVAFGSLVTQGNTTDIDLLEIVEGWQGLNQWMFSGTTDLPLRGQLRLYFLTPEEFVDPAAIPDAEQRAWVEQLLERVRQGYEIITQSPAEWAQQILEQGKRGPVPAPPPSGIGSSGSPLALTGKS